MNCLREVGQSGEANKGSLQSWSGINISEQVPLSESHSDPKIRIYHPCRQDMYFLSFWTNHCSCQLANRFLRWRDSQHWILTVPFSRVCKTSTSFPIFLGKCCKCRWQHLQREDCQHSTVKAFSASSPVWENTLTDVCSCCNSICGKAGQLQHLRNYFHSLPPPPMANMALDDDDAYDFQWGGGRRHLVWQENSGQSFYWQLAPPHPFSC